MAEPGQPAAAADRTELMLRLADRGCFNSRTRLFNRDTLSATAERSAQAIFTVVYRGCVNSSETQKKTAWYVRLKKANWAAINYPEDWFKKIHTNYIGRKSVGL